MKSNVAHDSTTRLRELALIFLKLGVTSFGGPAAHLAMMEEEFVRRRKWLNEERFIDLLGATNLIPGPNSTEMAMHIGHERAGRTGLVIAGLCFIIPAMLIVLAIAWGYHKFGALPDVQNAFYGIKPVILAVVIQAVWNLSRKSAHKYEFLSFAILSAAAALAGLSEIPILFFFGALAMIFSSYKRPGKSQSVHSINFFGGSLIKPVTVSSALAVSTIQFSNLKLFLFFLKVGSVLYGSGYVLLSFLQTELVDKYGWLTQAQLLDATAVGQFTPGPVFTTATFIGYLLSGFSGGLLATLGIFLPSFILVGFSTKLIPWLRRSFYAGKFLDGVNAASLGLMAAVTVRLGKDALIDIPTIGVAAISTVILTRWKPNSAWLVLTGALIGILRSA